MYRVYCDRDLTLYVIHLIVARELLIVAIQRVASR